MMSDKVFAFDAKRIFRNLTGLGNYSRLVVEQLAAALPEVRMQLFTPTSTAVERASRLLNMSNVETVLPDSMMFGKAFWRSLGMTRQLSAGRPALYHGLSNELPLNIVNSGVPSVVTIHDLIYRRLPYCYKAIDRRLYDFKYRRACENATRIIAVSRRTRDDIVEFYNIDPEKIDVVYQGCDESFRRHIPADIIEDCRRRYNLPRRYIIQVGTVERRKNLELTVNALAALDPELHLVAVGRDHYGYMSHIKELINRLRLNDRVTFLQNLPFADLPAIVAGAEVAAYPSRYEGFGIPVLEALSVGVPVVAANGSCLEEAGGSAALYVDPDDVRAMIQALTALTDGTVGRADIIARGQKHARLFENSAMADNILKVYSKIIDL